MKNNSIKNMSNETNKAIAALMMGASAVTSLSASSPVEEIQNKMSPSSSYSQQIDNPHIYPALTHGMDSDSQLAEAYQMNREDKEKERERDSDSANLAQNEAIASGSPEPSPSTQENMGPTDQAQQESNADLASQLSDAPDGTPDVSSEADEGSNTIG
jgi:hypothetical protein